MVLSFKDKHGHYLNIDTEKRTYNKETTADAYCILLLGTEDYSDLFFKVAYEQKYEFDTRIKTGEWRMTERDLELEAQKQSIAARPKGEHHEQ